MRSRAVALLILVCCTTSYFGNPDYVPFVPDPPHAVGAGPVVWFDEGHDNSHWLFATYGPFARLLQAAGYRPQPLRDPLDAAQLEGALLVLVLPQAPLSAEEIVQLERYVAEGGGLLLVTDHPGHPLALQPLGLVLGIDFMNVTAVNTNSPYQHFVLQPNAHFTSIGIPFVKTYNGSALAPFPGVAATIVLPFGADAVDESGQSLAGLGRTLALEHGGGRVYASAEAQMLSSICFLSCNSPVGFGDTDADYNDAHVVRVMRWLEGEG